MVKNQNSGKKYGILSLAFKKAFDTVDQIILVKILYRMDVSDPWTSILPHIY